MHMQRPRHQDIAETRNDAARTGEHHDQQSFIARIPMGQRVWAVPSIHGEAMCLARLHEKLAHRFRPGTDRIVYLGNYIGRGRAIIETIDELLRFRRTLLASPGAEPWDVTYLRGAQEEMWWKLLKLQMATDPAEALEWMMSHGVEATLGAYGGSAEEGMRRCRGGVMALTKWTIGLRQAMQGRPGHFELMTSLWRAASTGEGGMLFVHASIDPSRPLAMQGDIFWWDNGTFARIEEPYQGFTKVIRGYDNTHGGADIDHAHAATLDGGCGFGGTLIAACFNQTGDLEEVVQARS